MESAAVKAHYEVLEVSLPVKQTYINLKKQNRPNREIAKILGVPPKSPSRTPSICVIVNNQKKISPK